MKIAFVILALALAAAPAARAVHCSLSATGVSFGTYSPLSATPLDSTGTITFTCSNDTPSAYVVLDRGGAPSYNPRQMSSAQTADKLAYNLFQDAARTVIFGDGVSDGSQRLLVNTEIHGTQTAVIYGRVPAGQDVSAASYSDSVLATIFF